MTSFTKLSLCAVTFGAFAACATSVSSPDTGDENPTPTLDSGSTKSEGGSYGHDSAIGEPDAGGPGDDDTQDTGTVDPVDTGTVTPKDSGGGKACTLSSAALFQTPACDQCRETNCCQQINTCMGSSGCAAIFTCTNNCFDGVFPDGGTFDAAAQTIADKCWDQCRQSGAQTAVSQFDTQDNCVNSKCPTECQ
jgi:hypothetical protein